MIVGCFRGCFSFNAETKFEKARLQATYSGDYDPPSEHDIQKVLKTLAGQDQETRPDIAFSLIQSKMQYSESKNIWNYQVKNLILLDRCVEDRSFVNDIATMHILHVENYKDPDPKNNIIRIDGFIRKYFQYIKLKSRLYAKKNSSFNVSKSEKRKFFQSLSNEQIFLEMEDVMALFMFIIELVQTNTDPLKRISKRGYLEYKVNQYVFHLMLYTMMNLYITMFTIIAVCIERLQSMRQEEAEKIKSYYMSFLKNNELLTQFVDDHRFIKGYENIKVSDFYQPNRNAIGAINDWIAFLISQKNQLDGEAIMIKLGDDVQIEPIRVIRQDANGNILNSKYNQTEQQGDQSETQSLDSFRLDKQGSNNNNNNPMFDDDDNDEIYTTSRYYDQEDQKFLKFGQKEQYLNITQKKLNFLDSSFTGFNQEFFTSFKNDFSTGFDKKAKRIARFDQNNSLLEKSKLLETYFLSSFQNTVSFLINDRFTIAMDASMKEIPQFNADIFHKFVNQYSVLKPKYYCQLNDAKIQGQPEEILSKGEASQLNVQQVFTIQNSDTKSASKFIAELIIADESREKQKNNSNMKDQESQENSIKNKKNNEQILNNKNGIYTTPTKEQEKNPMVTPFLQGSHDNTITKGDAKVVNAEQQIIDIKIKQQQEVLEREKETEEKQENQMINQETNVVGEVGETRLENESEKVDEKEITKRNEDEWSENDGKTQKGNINNEQEGNCQDKKEILKSQDHTYEHSEQIDQKSEVEEDNQQQLQQENNLLGSQQDGEQETNTIEDGLIQNNHNLDSKVQTKYDIISSENQLFNSSTTQDQDNIIQISGDHEISSQQNTFKDASIHQEQENTNSNSNATETNNEEGKQIKYQPIEDIQTSWEGIKNEQDENKLELQTQWGQEQGKDNAESNHEEKQNNISA